MTTTTRTIQVGSLVNYHGSIASEHWATFYISAIDGNRLTLIDRDYPNVTVLRRVRCTSVTPTGQTINMCDCGHEAGNPGNDWNLHICEVRGCGCLNHDQVRTY